MSRINAVSHMLAIDDKAREVIEAEIGPIRAIRPIYPFWQRWAGSGGRTEPGIIEGRDGRCKIVVLRPELRDEPSALEQLARRKSVYLALSGCRGLPRVILDEDQFMVTEWWSGTLLSTGRISPEDLDGLARSVGETYTRMRVVANQWGPDEVHQQGQRLESLGLLPVGTNDGIEAFLARVRAPDHLRTGPCFGDVAFKNFVRRAPGEIGYIDTMGVDVGEMPFNLEKLVATLGHEQQNLFFARLLAHAPSIGDIRGNRAFFKLVLCLRQAAAKSAGGRGIVAIQRRMRARAAVRRLLLLLEVENSEI